MSLREECIEELRIAPGNILKEEESLLAKKRELEQIEERQVYLKEKLSADIVLNKMDYPNSEARGLELSKRLRENPEFQVNRERIEGAALKVKDLELKIAKMKRANRNWRHIALLICGNVGGPGSD